MLSVFCKYVLYFGGRVVWNWEAQQQERQISAATRMGIRPHAFISNKHDKPDTLNHYTNNQLPIITLTYNRIYFVDKHDQLPTWLVPEWVPSITSHWDHCEKLPEKK